MRESYRAGVFYYIWLEFSSQLKHLPAPGLERHRLGDWLILS